jgi:hypothetical protein
MCRRITCNTCGKPSWAGCGAHIEQVLGAIPPADRCHCREQAGKDGKDGKAPASGVAALLGKIFGH